MEEAPAIKGFVLAQHTFLQSRRHCKHLRRRARLIGITDTEIPPYLVPGNLLSIREDILPAEIIQNLILCNHSAVIFPLIYSCRLLFSKLHKLILCESAYVSGIVEIKDIAAAHSQYFAISGIHGNGGSYPASYRSLPFIYIFLKNILYVYINGGNDGLSINGRFNHPFQIGL